MASEKGKRTVLKFENEEHVAAALARYTAQLSQRFIHEKGSFSVVLSGGGLIDALRYLTKPPYIHSVEWSKWSIFWVDERVVPLTSDDSNYKLAYDSFLSKVPIPSSHIFAINDKLTPEHAAADYEERLKSLVSNGILPVSDSDNGAFPKFDLMLLGMGPDGHVASLFPNRDQQYEHKKWVTYVTNSPKPPPPRISFTFPVINSATEIAMVVTSNDLGELAVRMALRCENCSLPVCKVSAVHEMTWFLDHDAAWFLDKDPCQK